MSGPVTVPTVGIAGSWRGHALEEWVSIPAVPEPTGLSRGAHAVSGYSRVLMKTWSFVLDR